MATDTVTAEPRYLIDNSVWARLATEPRIADALEELIASSRPSSILICPPIAAEYGFSARNGADHDAIVRALAEFTECDEAPNSLNVLAVQNALWTSGLVRAAGVADTLIATYAVQNEATVVHYDRDFELIAGVVPQLRHQWIVARGSV